MTTLKVRDMYGPKSNVEVILGGELLKNFIKRQEELDIVYFSVTAGGYLLDTDEKGKQYGFVGGLESRKYLHKGFKTDVAVAPVKSLYALEEITNFLDSLVEDGLMVKEEFKIKEESPIQKYLIINHGKLFISKPVGHYILTAEFPNKEIAEILSTDENNKIVEVGQINNNFKIHVYPDIEIAKKAAPYFDERGIKIDLEKRVFELCR